MKRAAQAAIALLLVVCGCSSDPATSEEHKALEQELMQSDAELSEAVAAKTAVEEDAAAAAAALEDARAHMAPDELVALIDDWYAANERGDGAVLDL